MILAKLKMVLAAICMAFLVLAGPSAYAANNLLDPACQGAAFTSPICKQASDQAGSTTNPIVKVIRTAANIVASVAGIGAVIIILISGFTFVTAGGGVGGQRSGDNPTKARNARASLIGAVTGLVIIALAWSLVTFVTGRFVHT
jgi:hypothetical protein